MSERETMVRIAIDEMKCVGVGYCVKAEPDAVEMLDEGFSRPLPDRVLPRSRALAIVDGCPSGAIRIDEA